MKKVLIGLVVLIIIIAAAIYYVLGNLDSIVEAAIEKHGSAALKTSVDVGSVSINLKEGSAQINDLTIDNPKGFETDYLFFMGTTRVHAISRANSAASLASFFLPPARYACARSVYAATGSATSKVVWRPYRGKLKSAGVLTH